jgi:cobalt-zinc-cadmium efflux system protein
VTLLAAVIEIWISRRAGGLFLVADAVHLIAHLGIFIVLLMPLGRRHAAREDAMTCAVLLIVVAIAIWIAFRCVTTLIVGESAPPARALLFSLLGLVANLTAAWLFRDPAAQRWSFRVALAHEMSDASLTIAGLLGAGAIALYGFRWIDPALSLGIVMWLSFGREG